ncbi:MAG: GNAT family N-acetyltransferase [Proteobacteria bacterium]|nr:GNAT family N-acetyltransferase [Pseudomonadota bacterium]
MYSIINSKTDRLLLKQFREWVEEEWGKVDSNDHNDEDLAIPSPLLAVTDSELLGGLGFTCFSIPGVNKTGLWVNTLLVAPEYRNIGIGEKLVLAAEAEAVRSMERELFVYTDVPGLYQKLGWIIVDDKNESKVLKRVVSN